MDIDLKKLPFFSDPRGNLVELLTFEDIKRYKGLFGHLFFVTFKNNKSIRGNHYHKITHEYYIPIYGRIKVILKDLKTKKRKIVILSADKKKIIRLRIGPNIAHVCYGLTPNAFMIGYFSNHYDNGKDTVEHIIIKKKKI